MKKSVYKWLSGKELIDGKLPYFDEYLVERSTCPYQFDVSMDDYFSFLDLEYSSYKYSQKCGVSSKMLSFDDYIVGQYDKNLKYIERIVSEYSVSGKLNLKGD